MKCQSKGRIINWVRDMKGIGRKESKNKRAKRQRGWGRTQKEEEIDSVICKGRGKGSKGREREEKGERKECVIVG